MNDIQGMLGDWLAEYLAQPLHSYEPYTSINGGQMLAVLEPGDVLLVEGNTRVSTAIKYLTQSTWSHAALFIGDALGQGLDVETAPTLLEVDLRKGVIAIPLGSYARFNTRICRPINLSIGDRTRVVEFAVARLGMAYDLKNLFDLGRYLLPMPPVPSFMRRRVLSLGSGDPTRALCSSLIAQAFQSVDYPILPSVERLSEEEQQASQQGVKEIIHIRHHSLFVPRDFDLSPYFQVIKPLQAVEFDYRELVVADAECIEHREGDSVCA